MPIKLLFLIALSSPTHFLYFLHPLFQGIHREWKCWYCGSPSAEHPKLFLKQLILVSFILGPVVPCGS